MTAVEELTVREAAVRVGRSPETVRRWIWSGRLPATKRGNTYYVDVIHLERLVAEMNATSWHGESSRPGLAAWLAEVDQWRATLARSGSARAATASDLVTEDRHARR
jgi:excisionase family DNA binding protein